MPFLRGESRREDIRQCTPDFEEVGFGRNKLVDTSVDSWRLSADKAMGVEEVVFRQQKHMPFLGGEKRENIVILASSFGTNIVF